jgi:hypothetical protein
MNGKNGLKVFSTDQVRTVEGAPAASSLPASTYPWEQLQRTPLRDVPRDDSWRPTEYTLYSFSPFATLAGFLTPPS